MSVCLDNLTMLSNFLKLPDYINKGRKAESINLQLITFIWQ